ncbi:Protein CBG20520 [Caenorhabditis briggsae]|uniref:Protein CBG20520 n=1 Tax=Caenorhabditis briggsae TaxID=6238 RepID=A8XXZ8_CAEBR|nr:Protein CBG20520 [Caenorhabditis briggsae]CAP37517.2 Protein CBG20520 [Caenorhabditis briggsae]
MLINFIPILIFLTEIAALETTKTTKDLKCVNGHRPLLDENLRVFECARGCPDTFYCENQTRIRYLKSFFTVRTPKKPSIPIGKFRRTGKNSVVISCSNSTSQPLAKWYFDIQTLACEMYPFGMCEDDPLGKLALRTKEECEERCDVAKVKEALEKLGRNELSNVEVPNELPVVPNAAQIAIDDVIQESKHIRGRPFAIEPPTDLVHQIHVKSDRKPIEKLIEIDENQLLTTNQDDGITVPTGTSDILEILNDDGDVEGSGTSSKISGGSGILESETLESGVFEENENSEENLQENKITVKIERQQRSEKNSKSLKSMGESFERFYQRNKDTVSCSATPYRLLCPNGAPSQFVYRWEKVGGACQSFPYGYCLKQQNVPHPRTRAECEQFCD